MKKKLENKNWKSNFLSVLKDAQGKYSRKAIAGFSTLIIAHILIIYIIIRDIDLNLFQCHLLIKLLYVGGGLLGLTIFDKIK